MAVIDSYSESNQTSTAEFGSDSIAGGIAGGYGVCFTGDGQKIVSTRWYLLKQVSPPGNVVSKIWTMTGTFGTNGNVGTLLATSNNVAASSTPTGTPALVTFAFTGVQQYVTTNGTKYVATIEYTAGDATNRILIYYDNTGTHPGTWVYHALATSGVWTSVDAGIDFCFYVDGVAAPTATAQFLSFFT